MFLRSKVTVLVLLALFLGLVITAFNIWQLAELQRQHYEESARVRGGGMAAGTGLTYSLYAKHPDSGYLKHVWNVLGRGGYTRVDLNTTSDWDVLWRMTIPSRRSEKRCSP